MLVDAPFNEITRQIIGSAIEVHRVFGPGLTESPYTKCILYELTSRGLKYVVERCVPLVYKGVILESRLRVDLIVEDLVVVEIKSVEAVLPIHRAQVLTYMRLMGCPAGLLINFNVAKLVDGVVRLINTQGERAAGRLALVNGSPCVLRELRGSV